MSTRRAPRKPPSAEAFMRKHTLKANPPSRAMGVLGRLVHVTMRVGRRLVKLEPRRGQTVAIEFTPNALHLRGAIEGNQRFTAAPIAIEYEHARGGRYVHTFERGARLQSVNGTTTIAGVQIKPFIE